MQKDKKLVFRWIFSLWFNQRWLRFPRKDKTRRNFWIVLNYPQGVENRHLVAKAEPYDSVTKPWPAGNNEAAYFANPRNSRMCSVMRIAKPLFASRASACPLVGGDLREAAGHSDRKNWIPRMHEIRSFSLRSPPRYASSFFFHHSESKAAESCNHLSRSQREEGRRANRF